MASPMGPPGLPGLGYSLRVQLFAADSHAAGDRPIRCFRVVTTPDVTVRDFCQEASRIHEINYGEPIAIKKVQDDQEFDITQSEIIGNLFATASTIRVIQAAANPAVRDSVPPNSALRFEPSRKREREGSVGPNGEALASSYKTNKRQRVDPDPDLPLPSRESELGVGSGINGHKSEAIIPSSQKSIILGETRDTSRHVRKAVHRIPETPEPSLPPALHDSIYFENGIADKQGRKSTMPSLNDVLNPSPSKNPRAQSQVSNPSKAKSTSYHIPRSTERGTSVSTAATSPQSVDQQVPQQNGVTSASKRKRQDPSPKSTGRQHRSLNEETTYENIISDDEESALARMKQAALKIRNSPKSGLQGLEWAKDRLSTPPNGNRRTSRSRDEASAHNELPLTPNSKEREEKQRQRKEADEARKARLAAAGAAEQRKREAEEARLAKEERARREEQERLEIEDFQRGEAERQAAIAKAARLQKEREAKEKREAEERRLKETRIARDKAESQRLAREKAAAEEAKRLQKEEERKEKERKAEESRRLHEEEARKENGRAEALKSKISSSPPESLRHLKSSSPILPPSTTKLIPTGRKSALKSTLSSSQAVASSPAVSKLSPEITFNGVSIEQQMPLPKAKRVSFTAETAETPIKPSISRILPPKLTAKAPLTKPVVSGQISTPKPPKTTVLPPGRQSNTPIPLPQSVVKRQGSERSITPTVPTKVVPPQKKPSQEAAKKISPAAKITPRNSETPAVPKKKQPPPLEISSDESGSDEDIPSRVAPAKSAQHSRLATQSRSPAPKSVPRPQLSGEDDKESEDDEKENQVPVVENEQVIDEDETQSQNSSTRDSRSPVVFSQHAQTTSTLKRKRSASLESKNGSPEDDDEESSESGSSSDSEEDEEDLVESKVTAKRKAPNSTDVPKEDVQDQSDSDEDEESTSSDSESEDQGPAVQVPKSSPPTLPPSKRAATGSGPKLNQVKRKDPEPDSPESTSTQDELDQQLTSSLYEARSTSTPVPVSSSSAPRPTFKIGASLSSLNSNKPILGSSSASKNLGARGSQRVLNQDDDEDESEEESEEDSSYSSAEEEDSKPKKTTAAKPLKKLESSSTSDDESTSDSESESESEEDEEKKLRDELAAQIAGLGNGDSQRSRNAGLLSPKVYRSSTQQSQSAEKKKGKTTGRVISGYSFSQPV